MSWTKDETAYTPYEYEYEGTGDLRLEAGHNSGLLWLGSWRNTMQEWRRGSRARVWVLYLVYGLLFLAVLLVIGIVIWLGVRWAGDGS